MSTITLVGLKSETLQTSWDYMYFVKLQWNLSKNTKIRQKRTSFCRIYAKVDKSAQFQLINTFYFVFVLAKFSLFHVQKHDVFSKIGIQSMWKHLIQLNVVFSVKIGQKRQPRSNNSLTPHRWETEISGKWWHVFSPFRGVVSHAK